MNRRAGRYHPALDGLRGLAVAGVLLFHDGRLRGGFLGVDLFFALSGFLITSLLIDERIATGGLRLGSFWARRARRLLPAVLAFLVAIVPMMRWWGTTAQLAAARDGVWPAALYVANWKQIADAEDYWALFTDPSPMTHLWSLAVEEQFYVVWPLVALWCMRRARWRRLLGWVAASGAVASLVAMLVLYDPANPTRVYMGTDTRAFSILVGAVVALVAGAARAERFAARRPVAADAVQLALLAGVLASWRLVDGQTSTGLFRGGLFAHAAACALLAAAATIPQPTLANRALALAPLRWLGIVSYGLYLWHWPIFIVLDADRTGLDPLPLTVVRWAVSIAVAAASYRWIESPVRHRRRLVAPRAALGAIGAAAIALVATTVLVPGDDRQIASFDPASVALPAPPDSRPPTAPGTEPGTAPGTAPPVTTAPSTTAPARRTLRAVAWQGDSVAFDSAPGVVAALEAAGLRVEARTFLGVGLVDTETADPMALFVEPLFAEPPDAVIFMLSGWDGGHPVDVQRAALARYADALDAAGVALVLVTPPPVDPTRHESGTEAMLTAAQELAAARPGRVLVLDAGALWGAYDADLDDDGIPERKPDGVHVCPRGAALLGHWLVAQLAEHFDGIAPADPAGWAGGPWTTEPRYDDPPGACAPL